MVQCEVKISTLTHAMRLVFRAKPDAVFQIVKMTPAPWKCETDAVQIYKRPSIQPMKLGPVHGRVASETRGPGFIVNLELNFQTREPRLSLILLRSLFLMLGNQFFLNLHRCRSIM